MDFHEAQELWLDGSLMRRAARSRDEVRFIYVGVIDDRHWAAIVTFGGPFVRLISVRRARSEEVRAHERGRARSQVRRGPRRRA
ncbi:BrnT family toxin [Limnoraphis robusta]|uniref:BrnT family toxin n=1 Tax=Limnoraphis robusta TaxID=1118279 RepID=UPI00396AA3D5